MSSRTLSGLTSLRERRGREGLEPCVQGCVQAHAWMGVPGHTHAGVYLLTRMSVSTQEQCVCMCTEGRGVVEAGDKAS